MWFCHSRSLTLTCWLNQPVKTNSDTGRSFAAVRPNQFQEACAPVNRLSLCARNAEEKLFSIVWRRRTVEPPRFVHEEGGVCRGAVHEKGRVEMRGGGRAAALRP